MSERAFFLFSVKGQSLETSSDSVSGELRNSLGMTWTVKKRETTDIIQSASLVLGNNPYGERLFQGVNPINAFPSVKVTFGNRLTASWDGANFKAKLTELLYSDSMAFMLYVSVTANDGITPRGVLSKTIKIAEVRGMLIF